MNGGLQTFASISLSINFIIVTKEVKTSKDAKNGGESVNKIYMPVFLSFCLDKLCLPNLLVVFIHFSFQGSESYPSATWQHVTDWYRRQWTSKFDPTLSQYL